MVNLPDLRKAKLDNKKVFLRLDLDAPRASHGISDTTRIDAGFPTLEYLFKNRLEIIIGSHLGRPDGVDKSLTLAAIASTIRARLEIPAEQFREENFKGFDAFKIGERVTLLENLRFYKEEEKNDAEFANKLASLADIYVNEAFAVCHRDHASITGIPKFLPHFAGFRLQKEAEELSKVLENPMRPLVVVIGGAKIETKLPLVKRMVEFADKVLVGGEIAEEFRIKNSELRIDEEKVHIADLNEDKKDITSGSVQKFTEIINTAKTIVWNGPMGEISKEINRSLLSEVGTKEIAIAISNSSAHTIVGGGDTIGFLNKQGLLDKFSFVSTGGGAMLSFLAGEKLPGLEVLV